MILMIKTRIASLKIGIILALILVQVTSCQNNLPKNINVAGAANMQFSLIEIAELFEEETGIHVTLINGSSGKLTAQIIEGAPFDVFVSADSFYPQKIVEAGKNISLPKVYAYGNLVLLSLNPKISASLSNLNSGSVHHIAVGNPKSAPYGRAAEEALKYHKLYSAIESKLVFGESVAQTNQFLFSSAAEIALTAKSTIYSLESNAYYKFIELEKESYSPIEQSALLIRTNSGNESDAKKFFLFLFSDKAQAILMKNGYDIPLKKLE